MFVAKCIQDGRRVDFPLSQPFFKLLCTPWERGVARSMGTPSDIEEEEPMAERDQNTPASQTVLRRATSPENLNEEEERVGSRNSNSSSAGGTQIQQNQRSELLILESGGVTPCNEASMRDLHHGEGGAKGADLDLLEDEEVEISKDGGCKDDQVTLEHVDGEGAEEKSWFEDILESSDLVEVNPHLGRFLGQLEQLVVQRDAINSSEELSEEEKEQQTGILILPATEKNIPGTRLDDLWCVFPDAMETACFPDDGCCHGNCFM